MPYFHESQRQLAVDGNYPRLDRIEHALHAPGRKLKEWFGKNDPDQPTYDEGLEEAYQHAVQYLNDHGIEDIYVDVRRYEPGEQWRRLRENDQINPVFKYTDGAGSILIATIFPARVFHSDRYNPYTNTLTLNSTKRASALHQASSAKLYAASRFPGVRAFSRGIPLVPVFQEAQVASDVLSYARASDDWEFEKGLYPGSYAQIGGSFVAQSYAMTSVASTNSLFVGPALSLAGSGVGYGTGVIVVSHREKERSQHLPKSHSIEEGEIATPIENLE